MLEESIDITKEIDPSSVNINFARIEYLIRLPRTGNKLIGENLFQETKICI